MKVQIEGQHIRFRIDEEELTCLLLGEPLTMTTQLLHGQCWRFGIAVIDQPECNLVHIKENWILQIPAQSLQDYVSRLPCREGLEDRLVLPNGSHLMLNFQVDVRDSIQQRGPRQRK